MVSLVHKHVIDLTIVISIRNGDALDEFDCYHPVLMKEFDPFGGIPHVPLDGSTWPDDTDQLGHQPFRLRHEVQNEPAHRRVEYADGKGESLAATDEQSKALPSVPSLARVDESR